MVDSSGKAGNLWVIVLSMVLAGVLAIVPIPAWLELWRPDWIALALIYWVIALPHRIGMVTALVFLAFYAVYIFGLVRGASMSELQCLWLKCPSVLPGG